MLMWCGIDWAEHHHDVAVIDEAGQLRARLRIGDDAAGFTGCSSCSPTHGSTATADPGGDRDRQGAAGGGLRAAGISVRDQPAGGFPIPRPPLTSRAKSDAADALVLANILRTDAAAHRAGPGDTELAGSIRVLARAHQDAIWDRMQTAGKLRSLLREYYPTFLAAFDDLTSREARATLQLVRLPAAAPGCAEPAWSRRCAAPAAAATRRRRRPDPGRAEDRTAAPASRWWRLRWASRRWPTLRVLDTAGGQHRRAGSALESAYLKHPDAAIISSFPGLGIVLGARILGEIGDDRTRFADAHGLKAFAGTAPVTRASGMKTVVTMRVVRNKRLGQAAYLWALPMLAHSPGARAHYDRRRTPATPTAPPHAT